MTSTDTPHLPPPIPPKPPVPGECCERGCEMCMWDYYHQAQRRYEVAYADWQQRQTGCLEPSVQQGLAPIADP